MSFFPLAAAAAGTWLFSAYTYDLKDKASVPVELASDDPQVTDPFYGAVGHISKYSASPIIERGTFRSVQENVDIKGARIFLVDYGNGQRVVQYYDPRLLL